MLIFNLLRLFKILYVNFQIYQINEKCRFFNWVIL